MQRFFFLLLFVLLAGCSWMGPAEASFFVDGEALSRNQTKTMLGQGVAINTQICPGNYYAGLYATQAAIPSILNASFYEESTVEMCSFFLTMVPCDLNPDSRVNQSLFVGLYGSVIRSCGLKAKGID